MRALVRTPSPRAATLAGLAIVLLATVVLIARQPITASWARHADADATYVGSGVSILDGERTRYFDHPGMPLQALAAVTFGAQYAIHAVTHGGGSLHTYATQTMLNLDPTRVWYRGWAILIYLAGAVLSYTLVRRVLRSSLLGTAAGLLWIATPGIGVLAIQYRPDVLLIALCVVLAYLIAEGAEHRDASRLALAALLLGVTMTVKVHAAGMLVPLALAAVFRPPPPDWWHALAARLREFAHRRCRVLVSAAVVWIGLVVLLNARAWPFGPAPSQRTLAVEIVAVLVAYWLAALAAVRLHAPARLQAVVGPFPAFLLALVLLGIALSLLLVVSDAGITLQTMRDTLTGRGLNSHVPLGHRLHTALHVEVVLPALAFAIGTCTLAYRRRVFWPMTTLAGAGTMAAMAAGRGGGYVHYYAPAFMLAAIVALWIVSEIPGDAIRWAAVAAAAAGAIVAIVRAPSFPITAACKSSVSHARALLQPGEVALAPRAVNLPDIEYRTIVRSTVTLSPSYPFSFVSSTPDGLAAAHAQSLRPTVAVDPSFAQGPIQGERQVGTAGRYRTTIVFRAKNCGVASLRPA